MLAATAHSFAQQARLAVSLSWIGGYTNALTIVACGQVTSHMTGAVSQLGVGLAKGSVDTVGYLLALVAAFTVGAFAAGLLLEWARGRRWQAVFALPIGVEVGMLTVVAALLARGAADGWPRIGATMIAAAAMGLQNATITRISGGVVRTTHLTGVATDLGLELARSAARGLRWSRPLSPARRAVARWRLLLLGSIPLSFAFGAALGTLTFERAPAWAVLPPIAFLLVVLLFQIWHRRALVELVPAESVPVELAPAAGVAPDPQIGMFRAVPPPGASEYRFPDLGIWASLTDHRQRVLVLDVAALPTLDAPAALELRALMRHLREERRFLVLYGVGEGQLQALDDADVLLDFDADDLCHDRTAAEARARELALGR